MTLLRDGGVPDLPDLPRETADRVLRRAIELESALGEVVRGEQLQDIAREIDLDPYYLRMALAEMQGAEVEMPRTDATVIANRRKERRGRPAGRPMAPVIATLLGAGLLAMLTGVGVGATWSEYAGNAAFLAGLAAFVLGLLLMLPTLSPRADPPVPKPVPSPPPIPHIGRRPE